MTRIALATAALTALFVATLWWVATVLWVLSGIIAIRQREPGEPLLVVWLSTLLTLVIATGDTACTPLQPRRAAVASFRPEDVHELDRMQQLWVQHGFADPGSCGRDALVLYPATDDEVAVLCRRQSCASVGRKPPQGQQCSDGCVAEWKDGRPLLVVARDQPRGTYRHELGHVWQWRCSGRKRTSEGEDHPPAFMRWLREVEHGE